MEDLDPQKPTPDGDASTLDPLTRIERMLAADSGTENESQDSESADDVKPDGDGQQSTETQLTTSDLAKLLKLEEGALDLDEEGNAVFKTKVDGVEGAAKLQDLLKSYQLQEHVDRKSREAAERERALQKRAEEEEAKFQERIQYADRLNNIAAQQLLQEFQSIDWKALEQQDPGSAALWRQKFQERHGQLQQIAHAIKQEKDQAEQKSAAAKREALAKEAEKLPVLIPEWKDAVVAAKEKAELLDWAAKAGYEAEELEAITSKARNIQLLRKAMLADRLQATKPEIENKVRQAPKLVKPGQPSTESSKEQNLKNAKTAVKKSGGKSGAVEAYLISAGLV
ncbi:MAG TPA: hypothetical protein VFS41_11975 [Edaphobacter sp.]|nr:hypothetical protein [Edaphobacter sp.]